MRAEVIEDGEMPALAEEAPEDRQAEPPAPRSSVTSTNSTLGEQELDLILNVEDHDLDFEPEEGILDNTTEVKMFNQFFSLRPDFRTRRRGTSKLLRRSDADGCLNIELSRGKNFIKRRKLLFINEITTIIYSYLYYLYHISRAFSPQISIVILYDRIVC